MSTKEWYTMLLEDKVTMNPADENNAASLIPISIESMNPDTDWSAVWNFVRLKGLGSDLISFQFKMVHRLLPTRQRVARLGLDDGQAGLCLHCRGEVENLIHCFFDCPMDSIGRQIWPKSFNISGL